MNLRGRQEIDGAALRRGCRGRDNEPNATPLFKSARNSSSNQSTRACTGRGQTGVAKAYRIGANLVLTKPINVEQAKGTLRVARGLLRKNADTAPSVAAPAKAGPAPAATPFKPAIQNVEIVPAQNAYELPELEEALPAIAVSTEASVRPAASPAPEAKKKVSCDFDSSTRGTLPASLFDAVQPAAHPAASASFKNSATSAATTTGAASAPAPAKEIAPVEKKPPSRRLSNLQLRFPGVY